MTTGESDKRILWTGQLEWYNHVRYENGQEEEIKPLKCSMWEESTSSPMDEEKTGTGKDEEGETKDDENVDVPLLPPIPSGLVLQDRLYLHLIPRKELKKIDMEYLQGTRNLRLSMMEGGQLELNKVLRTGRYAGCIHVPLTASSNSEESKHLSAQMSVIILLYSRGKHAIVGYIPKGMEGFVEKLLEVIPDHSCSNAEEQREMEMEMEICDDDERNEGMMAVEINEIENVVDDAETDLSSMPQYWNYELPEDYKPQRYLAWASGDQESSSGVDKQMNYFKGCKWAPDGSCLMTNSDDDIIRLYNVPGELFAVADWNSFESEKRYELTTALKIKEGGQIYDFCWYPMMSSYDPVSCCFLTTTADAPVHLWDAFTGKLRASYIAYDHLDQVVAARSVTFDSSGQQIHCGFETMIRTFDITRPGRMCTERKLKHPQISELNQPGIISCITTNPNIPGMMAVGSYLKTVGLYHDDGSALCILQGHMGGVTHLKFSHDGTKLFSGGRKDSRLICWDLRQMGEYYQIYERVVSSNQRIYFDITTNDKYLLTGGTDGAVKVWDLCQEATDPVKASFSASTDCINGISVNPFIPLLATSSGQRHLPDMTFSDDEDESPELSLQPPQEKDLKLWKFC